MPFNPLDKHANITLSLNNMRAYNAGPGFPEGAVRSVSSYDNTKKFYFEVKVINDGGNNDAGFGIMDGLVPLTQEVGWGENGYEYRASGRTYFYQDYISGFPSYETGDILAAAVDLINGKIWFYKNGVIISAGGNPVTGVNPNYSGISSSVTFYIAAGLRTQEWTFDLHDSSSLGTYSPPTGYAWASASELKLFGNTTENSTVIVLNESDWTTETVVSGVVGNFEITPVVSGTKTILAVTELGDVIGFGNVLPI